MAASIERGFIPLPKVEQEQPEENIKIALHLPPYLDQDRIGVNLADMAKLCKLSGIKDLRIIGKTGKETSMVIPEISGINLDGSAIASKKVAKVVAPVFQLKYSSPDGAKTPVSIRTVDLKVNVNLDEIALRAEESGDVRSIGEWSSNLNNAAKTSIREAGTKNLLSDLAYIDKVTSGLLGIWFTFTGIALRADDALLERIAFGVFYGGVLKGIDIKDRGSNPDFKLSLIPGPQLDRALVLAIKSRTVTLFKDLHPDK